MKLFINKYRKDNTGSSMVIVIIALAFVGILSATIMWMALNNYRMKATDTQTKRSFYAAELIMEQIVSGVQVEASKAIDVAYQNVMQKYSTLTESEKQEKFCKEYVAILSDYYMDGPSRYNISKLRAYVDGYVDASDREFSNTEGQGFLYTIIGGTEVASGKGVMSCVDDQPYFNDNSVTLENIHLEFTDNNGFVSIINTDLVISAPEVTFTSSDTLPDIFDYAIIASEGLTDIPAAMGNVKVSGSVCGGENGITLHHGWEILNANMVVSEDTVKLDGPAASLKIGDAATFDTPEFWAKNIDVNKAAGNALDICAKSYIADDLTINSSNAQVKLQGEYYGYGNSPTNPQESSSVIVNGINTSLDMSGLDKLLLAGHSYIGTHSAVPTPSPDPTYDDEYLLNEDIRMGQSIAIKGEQIAYLVPDECIGILDGVPVYGKNPMSAGEYEALQTELGRCDASGKYIDLDGVEHTLTEVSMNTDVQALGKNLNAYAGSVKKVFYPSNGETLVYYYLVMNEAQANQYYEDYYAAYKNRLDKYFQVYTQGIKSNNSFTRIHTQGLYLSDADEPTEVSKLNPAQSMDLNLLAEESGLYKDIYESLQAKLIRNYYEVTNTEKTKPVFENIIEISDMNAFLGLTGSYEWITDDGIKAVISLADYNYAGDANLRLIVAKGDVRISADFTGLIVAGGTITVDSGVTVTNAADVTAKSELTRVLQQPASAVPGSEKPIDFFKNGTNYIIAGTVVMGEGAGEVDASQKPIEFSEIVRYQNWVKQ